MVVDRVRALLRVLNERNPMGLKSPGPEEYEPEALSIAARLTEACVDKQSAESQRVISEVVVRQALEFWFGLVEPDPAHLELAAELLAAYLAPEQANCQEVQSAQ